jgi:maltooligosyltrehalose trehalohydrolase
MNIGAAARGGGTWEFVVWAPLRKNVQLRIKTAAGEGEHPMERAGEGYWRTVLDGLPPDTLYLYVLDGRLERPDPASCYQPLGVHRSSRVVDHGVFPWKDGAWTGIALEEWILYEIHVGTFTPEGTFEAIIPRLPKLAELGVNALELMPVAQFPGERNWGYDGAYPFAVQNSYGGPEGLKRLVDSCHRGKIAVVLDVVYNHLGPEGNYLEDFGPYFTTRYRTSWGKAVNFDDAWSDGVRAYFLQNVRHWFEHYHIDGLRLDAVHGIFDRSGKHILSELSEQAKEFSRQGKRRRYLIAESDLNDARIARPPRLGGFGIDAQWNDDFEHSVHALLTKDRFGYYQDFGTMGDLAKAYQEGFVYDWRYSRYRKRHHGSSSVDIPASRFVVFAQNHDQVGNRPGGERLPSLIDSEGLKLAAAVTILSPFVPLLFMGEEYGEESPFFYFVSHSDQDLVEAVREGRREEFAAFRWSKEPPDPLSAETFAASRLDWEKLRREEHRTLWKFYQELIRWRRTLLPLRDLDKKNQAIAYHEQDKTFRVERWHGRERALFMANFGFDVSSCPGNLDGRWRKLLDSAETRWRGPSSLLPLWLTEKEQPKLQPRSCALYIKE